MAASEDTATPRDIQARQREIRGQVRRTMRAYGAVKRARSEQRREVQQASQQVAKAVDVAAAETADLVAVCGSVRAAAEILGADARDVRRLARHRHRWHR